MPTQSPSSRPSQLETLEPRQLLAADLVIGPRLIDDVPVGITVQNTFEIGGNRIGSIGPGQPVEVIFRLLNTGDRPAFLPAVSLVFDTDDNMGNGFETVLSTFRPAVDDGILPGLNEDNEPGEVEVVTTVVIPPLADNIPMMGVPGFIHVIPDPGNEIAEDNERNNFYNPNRPGISGIEPAAFLLNNSFTDLFGTQFNINTPVIFEEQPDFTPPVLTDGVAVTRAGEDVTLTYSIRNTGPANTNPFTATFFLVKAGLGPNLLLGTQDWISGQRGDTTSERTVTFSLPEEDAAWWDEQRATPSTNANYAIAMLIDNLGEAGEPGDIVNNNSGLGFSTTRGGRLYWGPPLDGDGNPLSNDPADYFTQIVNNTEREQWDTAPIFIWEEPELTANNELIDVDPTPADEAIGDNISVSNVALKPGNRAVVTVDIVNESMIASDAFTVSAYLSRDGVINTSEDAFIGDFRLGDGVVGANLLNSKPSATTIDIPVKLPRKGDAFYDDTGDGNYQIGIVVNAPISTNPATYEEDEGRYNDNANEGIGYDLAEVSISNTGVTGGGGGGGGADDGSDLRPVYFNVVQTESEFGTDFTIEYEVKNIGARRAGQTVTQFFAARNRVIGPEDQWIGSATTPALTPGQSTGRMSMQVSVPNGTFIYEDGLADYFAGIVVDGRNTEAEESEANNTAQRLNLGTDSITLTNFDMPEDGAGNNRRFAGTLGFPTATTKYVNDFVGGVDVRDYWKFNLNEVAEVTLTLDGLGEDANVWIVDRKDRVKAMGDLSGTQDEMVVKGLQPGRYWAVVAPVNKNFNTDYRLGIKADYSFEGPGAPSGIAVVNPAASAFTFTRVNTDAASEDELFSRIRF